MSKFLDLLDQYEKETTVRGVIDFDAYIILSTIWEQIKLIVTTIWDNIVTASIGLCGWRKTSRRSIVSSDDGRDHYCGACSKEAEAARGGRDMSKFLDLLKQYESEELQGLIDSDAHIIRYDWAVWLDENEPMICGHPRSAIVSSGEGTHYYCGECAREEDNA